ncbi:MAG: hypothetical protein H6698_05400 [Myxococcales bacterium]|nr:hypothetical protein [Myxococcales bacterium]MCB9530225.1 hypothetical protein [Myxococcales bacterium]MCB9533738.1 hypothetical protein [Myxococcales bacterium]
MAAVAGLAVAGALAWHLGFDRDHGGAETSASAWEVVADADAAVWVDLARLRADPRLIAVWDAAPLASARAQHPLGGVVDAASALALGWSGPLLDVRVNALDGVVEARQRADALADARGLESYSAGGGNVWSGPAAEWAVAAPDDQLLVTGTPVAVSAAAARFSGPVVATPLPDAARGAALWARLRVSDQHLRALGALGLPPELQRAAAQVGEVRMRADLGAGLDVALSFLIRDGGDADAVSAVATGLVAMVADELGGEYGHGVLGRAVAAATVSRGPAGTVDVVWEMGRADLEAALRAIAADDGEPVTGTQARTGEGSGDE